MAAPGAGSILGKRDRAILDLVYGTGIRRGECLQAVVMDVDLADGVLLVRDGKGPKERFVPVWGGRSPHSAATWPRRGQCS